MSAEAPGFVDVPFDGLDPERLVPTLPGLGLAMQPNDRVRRAPDRASDVSGASVCSSVVPLGYT